MIPLIEEVNRKNDQYDKVILIREIIKALEKQEWLLIKIRTDTKPEENL